jgi:iron complex transport system ATP-binding protein
LTLEVDSLRFRYPGGPLVLDGITARADGPSLIGIAGPNGAGKSTLLDLLAGLLTPESGACRVNGLEAHRAPRAEYCRAVAHVPQLLPAAVPFTVEQVILTGRVPHGRRLFESQDDQQALEEALALTHLAPLRHRPFSSLSGGERQRTLVAAALCQRSPVLMLDEPGAHLDPRHEADLWTLLRRLRANGRLILVVTHHLSLAARYCDRVWLLHGGRLAADAPPCDAFQPARLEAVFEVPFHWHQDSEGRIFLTYGH